MGGKKGQSQEKVFDFIDETLETGDYSDRLWFMNAKYILGFDYCKLL
jgi:hypothetical protein